MRTIKIVFLSLMALATLYSCGSDTPTTVTPEEGNETLTIVKTLKQSDHPAEIVGKWKNDKGVVYEFRADGMATEMDAVTETVVARFWGIKNNQVCLFTEGPNVETCFDYTVDGNQLTISAFGKTILFEKQ